LTYCEIHWKRLQIHPEKITITKKQNEETADSLILLLNYVLDKFEVKAKVNNAEDETFCKHFENWFICNYEYMEDQIKIIKDREYPIDPKNKNRLLNYLGNVSEKAKVIIFLQSFKALIYISKSFEKNFRVQFNIRSVLKLI